MAYTAYEVSTGDAQSAVEGLHRSYTKNGVFEAESNPTLAKVEGYLTAVHADMAGMMVAAGYAATQTVELVLDLLMQYNARGAAYYTELGMVNSGFAPEGGQSRLAEFAKWRVALDDILKTDALDHMGAGMISSGSVGTARLATAGGISISENAERYTDPDFNPMKTDVDFSNRGSTSSNNPNLGPQ